MSKLTYMQAAKLIQQASQESTENKHYRFGQALWNLLPKEVGAPFYMTDKDFFLWADNAKVMEVFYENFVDNTVYNSK